MDIYIAKLYNKKCDIYSMIQKISTESMSTFLHCPEMDVQGMQTLCLITCHVILLFESMLKNVINLFLF
jgi:hypothetical protein